MLDLVSSFRAVISHLMAHIKYLLKFCDTKKCFLLIWQKKTGIILIHSHWIAIVVLANVILLFDNIMKKRSMSLTKQASHVLKIPVAHQCALEQLLKITNLENISTKVQDTGQVFHKLNSLSLFFFICIHSFVHSMKNCWGQSKTRSYGLKIRALQELL